MYRRWLITRSRHPLSTCLGVTHHLSVSACVPKCQCIPELFLSPQDQCRGHYSSGDCVISSVQVLPDWPRYQMRPSDWSSRQVSLLSFSTSSSFLVCKFSRKDSRFKLELNLDLKITSCFYLDSVNNSLQFIDETKCYGNIVDLNWLYFLILQMELKNQQSSLTLTWYLGTVLFIFLSHRSLVLSDFKTRRGEWGGLNHFGSNNGCQLIDLRDPKFLLWQCQQIKVQLVTWFGFLDSPYSFIYEPGDVVGNELRQLFLLKLKLQIQKM